jgi:DNA-binding beta-propeller fold protein YncE
VIYNRFLSIAKTSTTVGAVLHLAGIEAAGTSLSRSARYLIRSAALVALSAAGFTSLIGCGNTYRPVVSAINPVGPSSQPQKFAVAISNTGPNSPGLVTLVDFSGDTVLITAAIGVAPQYLILTAGGTTGYTINGDGTLNVFSISTSLIASQILETTLLAGAAPVSILPQGTNTYVTETGRNAIGQFISATSAALSLRQELAVANPIYVVGLSGSPRVYAISQGTGTNNGQVIAIDTTTNTTTAALNVGRTPVYGVMTSDGRRAFILNQGDGTVSVINVQTNQLDTLPATSGGGSTIPVGVAPLWADFAPTRSEMVVANAGNGTSKGTLSIVSIPLCNAAALVTNPNCSATNPIDAVGFGTVLASVPVGISPIMVAALQDGTRAYVANAGDPSLPCVTTTTTSAGSTTTPTGNCTVSVVSLATNTVTATIPIAGRPAYIAATTGTPTGKVYVVCKDSNSMTVIRTDIDAVDTTVPLQGTGVSVRVTAQ